MKRLIDDNAPEVLRILLKELGIKYTNVTINKLKQEPYFPYIDAVSHSLNDLGVKNIVFETSYKKIKETIPTPFIVHINDNGGMLLVVKAVTENRIVYAVENNKYETQSKEDFLKSWSGYVLMVDTDGADKIEEENYRANFIKSTMAKVRIPILGLLIIGFSCFPLFQHPVNYYGLLFLFGTLAGIIFNILILILEADQNNPLINNICSSLKNKKINCSGILNSKGSSFFGLISWSHVGMIYFIFLLCTLLVFRSSTTSLTVVSILSIMAFGYTFYSIYYQWKIAKKWCKLCLFVQSVLLYLFITGIFFLMHVEKISLDLKVFFYMGCLFLGVIISSSYILQLVKKRYVDKSKIQVLNSFKYSPKVFSMYWKNEKMLSYDTLEGKVISYGKENSQKQIGIIINPTCSHCITAHNALLKIFKRFDDIFIREVFFIPEDDDLSYGIALKMVDIYLNESKDYFLNALRAYYKYYSDSPKKWIRKYWNKEFQNSESEKILKTHRSWCEEQKLTITPQVTLNNVFLPKGYTVQDLKYFL